MYNTCLFCSASLGTNEAIESFPVGNRVAFDAWKGRLWAACARCGRWNLAPIEERWETVEEAERLFVDTRTRVHSENIGLARLRDGTRLIRVGKALPGELAAWRYGGQLISRRRQHFVLGGGGIVAAALVAVGAPVIAGMGAPLAAISIGLNALAFREQYQQKRRVVHVLPGSMSPTGYDMIIRRWHLYNAVLAHTQSGDMALQLPPVVYEREDVAQTFTERMQLPREPLQLEGDVARRIVARSMSDYNYHGASKRDVEAALQAITTAGGADEFARQAAASGAAIVRMPTATKQGRPITLRQVLGTFRSEVLPVQPIRGLMDDRPKLSRTAALALEMALQEESERRALEGELAALEAAWREAEQIARIADALPDESRDDH